MTGGRCVAISECGGGVVWLIIDSNCGHGRKRLKQSPGETVSGDEGL